MATPLHKKVRICFKNYILCWGEPSVLKTGSKKRKTALIYDFVYENFYRTRDIEMSNVHDNDRQAWGIQESDSFTQNVVFTFHRVSTF